MPSKIVEKTQNEDIVFDCGCSFPVKDGKPQTCFDAHNPNFTINPDCKQTWDDLEKFTQGVFQLELPSGKFGCEKLKPRNLEHIGALGAILRPGCAEAKDENGVSIKDHYIKRKNNLEEVEPYQPIVDEVLKDTYGCMIYQENAMKLAVQVGGFNEQEADSLRKAIGKKIPEEMTKSKKLFMEKAVQKGILSEKQIEEVFGWIEKSQRYSFNKCLAGDTIITAKRSRGLNIGQMFEATYYTNKQPHARAIRHNINTKSYMGFGLSLNEKGELVENKILDITYAGHLPVFLIILKDGSKLEVTANHKIPTDSGELTVEQLQKGDRLYTKQKHSQLAALTEVESVQQLRTTDTYDVHMQAPYHNLCVNEGIVVCNSHAISYGLLGFISAYIKTHFPLQFYCAWLKNEKTEAYKGLVEEAKLFADINVYTPDLRDLERDFYIKGGNIRFGLTNVKNMGEKDYIKLIELYAEDSKKWPELLFYVLENINSKAAESLILAGALDYFKLDRQRMLIEMKECDKLFKTAKKEKQYILENLLHHNSVVDILKELVKNLKGARLDKVMKVIDYLESPIAPLKDTVDSILFAEKNLLGVALTTHASENLPSAIETHSCLEIVNGYNERATLKVHIDSVKTHNDKNGNEMAFIQVSDISTSLKAVIFWEAWTKFKYLVSEGALLFVVGHMGQSFIVENVYGN
jgi:DNA polymerase III alpha subunit